MLILFPNIDSSLVPFVNILSSRKASLSTKDFNWSGEKCCNFVPALNPATMTESGKKRILLVDDHIDTINAVRVLLERRGYEVETANTVTDAKAVFYGGDFDLLISDIGLPDGTGHQLLNEINLDRPIRAI